MRLTHKPQFGILGGVKKQVFISNGYMVRCFRHREGAGIEEVVSLEDHAWGDRGFAFEDPQRCQALYLFRLRTGRGVQAVRHHQMNGDGNH